MKGAHLRLGLLIGTAVFLAGNFATHSAESGSGAVLFWAVLGIVLGLLIAVALERTARDEGDAIVDEAPPRPTTGELKAVIPTSSRFYAVSRSPSSSELRALMVDAPTMPGNPIATRLQLIVERYDAYARVALSEGSLLEYGMWEVAERTCDMATSRAPVTHGEAALVLVSVVSEGPLDERGRSPAGWTFEFVDGALGAFCVATVTSSEMLLTYRTAVSYPRDAQMPRLDPKRALAAVREAHPWLAERSLYLRIALPHEYVVWSRWPELLFQLDPASGALISGGASGVVELPDPEEALTVDGLVETLTVGADTPFRTELLACRRRALREAAYEVFAAHGPVVVAQLDAAAKRLADEEPEAARSLIHVLGYVPSDLAQLALERLADELPTEMEGIAFSLFEKRRHQELAVRIDPFEGLDFETGRRLLGKVGCRRLALRSTYDPEGELLVGLERYGLRTCRVRLLSGDTELFLAATLTSEDGLTDGQLSSSPLPVPCHILRLVGVRADELADRLESGDLAYARESIVEDVLNGRPYDLHRGALYMAALELDAPETFEALKQAIAKHRTNVELRRACVASLAVATHNEVDAFLATLDDADLTDIVRAVAKMRAARAEEPSGVVEHAAG